MHLQAIYVSEELSSPVRQLPLSINLAIPTVILSFLIANAGYYILLPWDVVSTTDSVAVVRALSWSSLNLAYSRSMLIR